MKYYWDILINFFIEFFARGWRVVETAVMWWSWFIRFRFLVLLTLIVAIVTGLTLLVRFLYDMVVYLIGKMDTITTNLGAVEDSWSVTTLTQTTPFDTAKTLVYCISLDRLIACLTLGLAIHCAFVAYRFLKSWLENGW